MRVVVGPLGGVGDADQLEQVDRPRPRLGLVDLVVGTWTASAICHPTEYTGFSEVIGSWKIIAIFLPRKSAQLLSADRRASSVPANSAAPLILAVLGSRPMIAST